MPELLPTLQARRVATGLVDYLTTTFSLADATAATALTDFLGDAENGIFKGPYVRLRLPFRPADADWQLHLEWTPGWTPYRHQAQAYARLTSLGRTGPGERPLPTLITTGTGSGKTEAFLHPILDHVVRAKRAGIRGTKAIILYPMNALADDQARRLTQTLTDDPALAGVTAAIYTGNQSGSRTTVSPAGLITDRHTIRDTAPDILLTNYKMLDQLLLRADDQPLWKQSARSLTYLVLDEFHTYDGAQGTDVAMLLRRLGLALKSHWNESDETITAEEWRRPLGRLTPVATSATLGDKSDPSVMLDFAHTVFGERFDADAVVTETLLSLEEWTAQGTGRDLDPVRLSDFSATQLESFAHAIRSESDDPSRLTRVVLEFLHEQRFAVEFADELHLLRRHPDIGALVEAASAAVDYDTLLAALDCATDDPDRHAQLTLVLEGVLAALSHVRAQRGREAVSVDLHLWVRELTRIDRVAASVPAFHWSDDGTWAGADSDEPGARVDAFPAVYCRHCGRSGWGISLAAVGDELSAAEDSDVRRDHLTGESRFRALLHAPVEDAQHEASATGESVEGLRWLSLVSRSLLPSRPDPDDEDMRAGRILPVLTRTGKDADERNRRDDCPACLGADGIRFLGSATATLISVSLSVLFGSRALDSREKKSLVFTDSVQDAAHRAGFVQSRSHVMSLRAAMGGALTDVPGTLTTLVSDVIAQAGDDSFDRFRLVPPDCERLKPFRRFWEADEFRASGGTARTWVERRLLFDASLEFGLQSGFGRTLEATGTAAAEVEAGPAKRLHDIAAYVIAEDETQSIDGTGPEPAMLTAWVRGTLEHMRHSGGIDHEWLAKYIRQDGARYPIWGGRPRTGMPAFPTGRATPAFPRVGGPNPVKESGLDTVRSAQSWYARWAVKCLQVSGQHGAKLAERLLAELARRDVLTVAETSSGAKVYAVPAASVTVRKLRVEDLEGGRALLVCSTCRSHTPGAADTVAQLDGAPCFVVRCTGRLAAEPRTENFYRQLYSDADMQRVVAREHTSLLADSVRRDVEEGFKSQAPKPDDPNVLVATPTLEMGIDIGDLSTVMLSSLPKSVAQYVQRVGRAGRLTGNALDLAYVTGRGDQLPRLGSPLSLINGAVIPPATYLDAEEILRRQYIASLVDAVARAGETTMPTQAKEALRSTGDDTLLGTVLAYGADGVRLEAFLAGFDSLSADVVDELRTWAKPQADGEWGENSLGAVLRGAVEEWKREEENLQRRADEIEAALPGLQQAAESPAAGDDDRRDFRLAVAAARTARREITEYRSEHWVAALEKRGILPNYTLLDDTVTLDARITWLNAETSEFETEPTSIERPSARALTELAPGAVFYTHRLAMRIDGLDLGKDAAKIRSWIYCAACGYGTDCTDAPAPGACPRCGSVSVADTGQRFDVVKLEHVFAEVRRERDTIDDADEQRRRTRFTTVTAADLDEAHVARRWHVGNTFCVAHHRRLDIRWLNLGLTARGGFTDRRIAGVDVTAQPFRVCAGCGKLDSTAKSNGRHEHRPWCRYHDARDEDTRTLILSRELSTEGIVVTLPPHIVGGDSFAVPSLAAALLLGLREDIGGAPDHLQVATIPVPPADSDGDPDDALLLHDVVPGGTGYLADLASPERMWRILVKAYRVLETCPCQDEGERRACHRCLLSYALDGRPDRLSRLAALRHLRTLLGLDDDATGDGLGDEEMGWEPEEGVIERPSPESHLERTFRTVFAERVQTAGGQVKQVPGDNGNELVITGLSAAHTWRMVPQVNAATSKPDFVFRTEDPHAPDIAVFVDGHQFHATTAHNRIADDAAKRSALRDSGYAVLSVTHRDLEVASGAAAAGTVPAWLSDEVTGQFLGVGFGSGRTTQGVIEDHRAGAIDVLIGMLQNPADDDARTDFSDGVGLLLALAAGLGQAPADGDLRSIAAAVAGGETAGAGAPGSVWSSGALTVVTRAVDEYRWDAVVVLDDRTEAIERPGHDEDWRAWLRIANAVTPGGRSRIDVTSVSALAAESDAERGHAAAAVPATRPDLHPAAVGAGTAVEFSAPWAAVSDELFLDEEIDFAHRLDALGLPPFDAAGYELDGYPADLAWTDKRVAVFFDPDSEGRETFAAAGWRIAGPDPDALHALLTDEETPR